MSLMIATATVAALAASAPAAELVGEIVEQPKITVTASRVEQSLDESLASVTVLSRQDIELSQAEDLLELLGRQAGIDISRSGGAGSQTSLFLRGGNSNHALVLVDGVRVASVHTGAFAWENLPLAQVDHVEIVRGPRAGYYGSDAIGGVIHIHTRRRVEPGLRLTAGSFGTRRLEAGSALDLGPVQASISVDHQDVGGFSAQNPAGFSFHPDDDGFEESGAVIALSGEFAGQRFAARLRAHRAEVEFDQGLSETDGEGFALRLGGPLGGNWRHVANLGWAGEERITPAFFSSFDSERADLDWQLSYAGRPGQLVTMGLAYIDESGISRETFGPSEVYGGSRHNAALFGGWQLGLGRQDLEVSLRYDDNSEFGSEWTGHLAWARALGQRGGVFASYGTAFRAPTLSEQLSPGFGGLFAGNRELEPERSRSAEIGVRAQWRRQRLGASVYRTRIEDLISFSGPDFRALNVARAQITGLEAEYQWRSPNWRLYASLTLQRTEDKDSGQALLRRPDEKLSLAADRLFAGGARFGADVLFSGDREDFSARLDRYLLLGLRASYPLSRRWRLQARLSNVLDEDYELAAGFNSAGRAAYLSLAYGAD